MKLFQLIAKTEVSTNSTVIITATNMDAVIMTENHTKYDDTALIIAFSFLGVVILGISVLGVYCYKSIGNEIEHPEFDSAMQFPEDPTIDTLGTLGDLFQNNGELA